MEETFHLFWNGPFSQWHPSEFTYQDMIFNCAEQWMMFHKALCFHDFKIAAQVMESNSPKEQKALGRKVENFDVRKWSWVAREIVAYGSMLKYTQNLDLCAKLCATYPATLVEASPYDKIWGIGRAEKDPLALDRKTWNGKNWLGETLTKVRNGIMSSCDLSPSLITSLHTQWNDHEH